MICLNLIVVILYCFSGPIKDSANMFACIMYEVRHEELTEWKLSKQNPVFESLNGRLVRSRYK